MFIGIDLGTTHSVIGVWREHGVELIPNARGELLTPSVVALGEADTIWVGDAALDRLVTHPDRTAAEFKRYMGTDKTFHLGARQFTPEELSALVLRSLKHDAESYLGQAIDEAVISVPAYFNDRQRRATQRAAQLAGLTAERLINEPSAAALAYGLDNTAADEKTFLILDLGGGTFDVSILEIFQGTFEIRASAGDNHLGGSDFTEIVLEHFLKTHALNGVMLSSVNRQRLTRLCESLKRRLSNDSSASAFFDVDGTRYEYTLDREGFQTLCRPLWERLRHPLVRALNDAKLKTDDLAGVVLVGGATRMHALRSQVSRLFGMIPMSHYQPDHAVAMGATIQAMLKSKRRAVDDIVMTDVCPYTLGVEVVNRRNQLEFMPIIERNTTIPVSETRAVYTCHPNQETVVIKAYQGESYAPKDNVFLGELTVELPKTGKIEELLLTYTYDLNGVLEVEVCIVSIGHKQRVIVKNKAIDVDESLLMARFEALQALKILPRDQQENIALLARLERLFEEALGRTREQIAAMISAFRAALDSHNKQHVAEERERINKQLCSLA